MGLSWLMRLGVVGMVVCLGGIWIQEFEEALPSLWFPFLCFWISFFFFLPLQTVLVLLDSVSSSPFWPSYLLLQFPGPHSSLSGGSGANLSALGDDVERDVYSLVWPLMRSELLGGQPNPCGFPFSSLSLPTSHGGSEHPMGTHIRQVPEK